MDDDIASRWGPRIVDYMRAVADAVQRVAVAVVSMTTAVRRRSRRRRLSRPALVVDAGVGR